MRTTSTRDPPLGAGRFRKSLGGIACGLDVALDTSRSSILKVLHAKPAHPMTAIRRATEFDSTRAFLRDPYRFISKRCRELGSDLFETRLMLRRVVCVTGSQATQMFYTPDRFT